MVKIEWNPGLSVGVELIDEQHKELLAKLNDISSAVEAGEGVEAVSRTLDFMVDYTEYHFKTEEDKMRETGYPRLEYHMRTHKEFVDMLEKMVEEFKEDGATQRLAESVNIYLFNWLVTHIRGVDGALGRYLREKGLA